MLHLNKYERRVEVENYTNFRLRYFVNSEYSILVNLNGRIVKIMLEYLKHSAI